MVIDDADPATMDSLEYARVVKKAPSAELVRVMSGPRRAEILGKLVRGMPDAFRAEVAGPLRAVVHWRLGGRADGGHDVFEMVIADGVCTVSPEPGGEPHLVLTANAADFVRLVTGNTHAVMLVMTGKLRTRGDLALTAKFPHLFAAPKP